jgi:thiol-disulfide isomerase/thioredoxin
VVAVIVIALIAAIVIGSGDGDGGDTATDGGGGGAATVADDTPARVEGNPLPDLPDDTPDPAVGTPMPVVSGTTFDGDDITIPTPGTPTLVIYVAHWCPHCQAEVPLVQKWVDEGGLPDGVDLVTVSTAVDSRRPNYPPAEWLASEGWTAPVLVDGNNQAADAAGLTAFPFFVAVDGQGNVVERTSGELPIDQLSSIADELAAGAS